MPPLLSDLDRPAPLVLAPTGMVPTRAMTPHVPLTPAEIAADVAAAASVGITSVHLHARDDDGDPTWEREVYARIVGAVREKAPEVVINVSTSGRTWSEVERRADCLALDDDLKPDLASLTLSSLNFLTQASVNSPDTIHALAQVMLDRGIVPELELFDFGMVNYVGVLQRKGLLPGPVVANLFFGNVAGMQATLGEIGLAVDRLPAGTIWSGAGLGDFGLPVQSHSIAAGGGVRVGLEDGIWFDRGRTRLATNPMLVERVHELLELHGRTMMTPDQLRARLAAG
ncbi:uncharacterized protein (DUF849 family) [Nocardioides sp. BE266]|uniref:3-keto-5-aminohexanoate cleavage protein n=1 Tax=Nocardioides sp. BE266 TaxID=2817725 RepID=UPI002857631F|nr:3-keto-5-aminohexanoate cleavage protein [Nocardioides sp. BE266]MDR7253415.1 uncharacterized protein (DUF849 family) [Nocardioides sp. BE266]